MIGGTAPLLVPTPTASPVFPECAGRLTVPSGAAYICP
jgi:hypothetical protein